MGSLRFLGVVVSEGFISAVASDPVKFDMIAGNAGENPPVKS